MVGFLLVKCMFHTVQLRNVGEHKTVGVPGGTSGPQPGKLVSRKLPGRVVVMPQLNA